MIKLNKKEFDALNFILHEHLNSTSYYKLDTTYCNDFDFGVHRFTGGVVTEDLLLKFEEYGLWKRTFPEHPLVGRLTDIGKIKKVLKNYVSNNKYEENYRGFKIVGEYKKSDIGNWYMVYESDVDGKKLYASVSVDGIKRQINDYLSNKKKVNDKEKYHVFGDDGSYSGGLIFVSNKKLNEYLYTRHKYIGGLDEFVKNIKNRLDKEGEIDDYYYME